MSVAVCTSPPGNLAISVLIWSPPPAGATRRPFSGCKGTLCDPGSTWEVPSGERECIIFVVKGRRRTSFPPLRAVCWEFIVDQDIAVYYFFSCSPPPHPREECGEMWWVCLSVCLSVRSHNSKTTRPNCGNFFHAACDRLSSHSTTLTPLWLGFLLG